MKELTRIEEILLLSIWRLEDQAYGVKIRHNVSDVIGKEFTYGNLYSALNQLTKKKYVVKILGESTPERRGRRRIYYKLSSLGLEALRSAYKMKERLWAGVSGLALEMKSS